MRKEFDIKYRQEIELGKYFISYILLILHFVFRSFNNVIEKNRVITKLKFKCKKGCGAILSFDEIKEHYNSNCLAQKSKIKILSINQMTEFRKKNKKIEYVTSKY